jgi:hypothetical protein
MRQYEAVIQAMEELGGYTTLRELLLLSDLNGSTDAIIQK